MLRRCLTATILCSAALAGGAACGAETSFPNDVVPIFTKLGCNSGGCHGKAAGQNGFRLSLLGFDPEADYAALVKEARGRRISPAAPATSMLLRKGTGDLPHGGGRRLDERSEEYEVLREWIAKGAAYGAADAPRVAAISVSPDRRILGRRGRQQLAVTARYDDGTTRDVTRRAQYETNAANVASVSPEGLVETHDDAGETAVMVRYQGQVAVFRATVPSPTAPPNWEFPPQTIVDGATAKKWRELGLMPSEVCDDATFLRRVSLDIAGTLPTAADVRAFTTNTRSDKRARLVDRLLESPEYAYYLASKWAEVLKVKRGTYRRRAPETLALRDWIREAVASNLRYDEFVRAFLTATGPETRNPPVVWYRETATPEQLTDDTAQVFLGLRLNCANCHHHPYEKWSQDDYWGLAAFFGRLGRKDLRVPGMSLSDVRLRGQGLVNLPTGSLTNKRTGKPAVPRALDGEPVEAGPDEDLREKLVAWMVDPKNPFFARAVVNRYWAHFFSRGIVDPLDDMRATNPPSNPELLDALAEDFVRHDFDLKHLIRTIVNSRTYQLSAEPNEFNRTDQQAYARYYPKRLGAEVLLDAIARVTGATPNIPELPRDRHAPVRAIQLADESYGSYFLDVFGRPQRNSACACERVGEANLAQALHLLNSEEMQALLADSKGAAARWADDPRPEREKIEELFLSAVGKPPVPRQLELALANVAVHEKQKRLAYENILWAVINTKEFLFNK